MCLYPKLIKNPKYKANKKNGGIIPAVTDERVMYVPIGCQRCIECLKLKAREWRVRLSEEIRTNTTGKFITLTFSNESICELTIDITKKYKDISGYELDNEIATLAIRRFLERWRKKHKKSVRHWFITELGHNGTENIHLHGIIFTTVSLDTVEKIWKYGFVWKGKKINGGLENYVNEQTINYMTKYVTKLDEMHKHYTPKILCSAGIGGSYTQRQDSLNNKYKKNGTNEKYRTRQGVKLAMPIYYRNKIYTDEEKEKLWIEKLDKQERWILGAKVSIKNGEEEYNEGLKEAQKLNKELGYGDGERNWNEEQYERERRMMKQKERIQKAKPPAGPSAGSLGLLG